MTNAAPVLDCFICGLLNRKGRDPRSHRYRRRDAPAVLHRRRIGFEVEQPCSRTRVPRLPNRLARHVRPPIDNRHPCRHRLAVWPMGDAHSPLRTWRGDGRGRREFQRR